MAYSMEHGVYRGFYPATVHAALFYGFFNFYFGREVLGGGYYQYVEIGMVRVCGPLFGINMINPFAGSIAAK